MTSSNFQFFYQAARLTIFLDDEQHVADIYPDAMASQLPSKARPRS